MRTLPIAGALATPAEIAALAKRATSRRSTDNDAALHEREARRSPAPPHVDNPGDFNRAIPVQRRGVTVLINDSGIDGTHDDLKFGTHVVQNTSA
jgi:serine protease AprX